MKSILFDTDVLIEILRNHRPVIRAVYAIVEESGDLSCSCVTVGEIFAGVKRGEEPLTKKLLDGLVKIPVTAEIAKLAGKLKNTTKTHTLWLDDCFIAATAMLHGSVLVTRNIKHYPFEGLTVQKI